MKLKRKTRNIIAVGAVIAIVVVSLACFAHFGGGGASLTILPDAITTVEGSTSSVFTQHFVINPGIENAVSMDVKVEKAGVYEVLFKISGGESTRVFLKNETYDKENELVSEFLSTNVEGTDEAYALNGYSKYACYVYLVEGDNSLAYWTESGSLTCEAVKLTQKTGDAQIALVDLSAESTDVYTESAKVSHEGTAGVSYGKLEAMHSVVLMGGAEASDSYQHTFTVEKSGTYDLALLASGAGAASITIRTASGESVLDIEETKALNEYYDHEVSNGKSGSTALLELGKKISLKADVTYVVTIETQSWINYAGLVLSK